MRVKYGKTLRKYLNSYYIELFNDYSDNRIFSDATVDTSVLQIKKDNKKNRNIIINQEYFFNQEYLDDEVWSFDKPIIFNLKLKILNQSKLIKDIENIKIYRGLLTGCNDAFIITEEVSKDLLIKDEKNKNIIKKVIRGKDLEKHLIQDKGFKILLTKNGIDIKKDYPTIYKYLLEKNNQLFELNKHKTNYKGVKNRLDQGNHWTNLRNCSYYNEFEKTKLIWQRVCKKPIFILDKNNSYLLDSMAFLTSDDEVEIKLLYAILNSPIIEWYLNLIGHKYGKTGYLLSNQYVERLPIPLNIDIKTKNSLLKIVDDLEFNNENIEKNQKIINEIIYQLYNLNESEITIIENKLE